MAKNQWIYALIGILTCLFLAVLFWPENSPLPNQVRTAANPDRLRDTGPGQTDSDDQSSGQKGGQKGETPRNIQAAPTLPIPPAAQKVIDRLTPKVQDIASERAAELTKTGIEHAVGQKHFYTLQTFGGEYTIATVEVNGIHWDNIVCVFSMNDELLYDSRNDHKGATTVEITSFGLPDKWFMWLQWWHPDGEKAEFPRLSNIVPIDGTFETALRVEHFANDVAHSSTPSQASAIGGPGIIFRGTDRTTAVNQLQGEGSDGNMCKPFVYWHAEKGLFYGPASVRLEGSLAYRVNRELSKKFEAQDGPGK